MAYTMSTVNSITKKKVGPFAIQDTGAPGGRSDYKTLVIVHGTGSPGGELRILCGPVYPVLVQDNLLVCVRYIWPPLAIRSPLQHSHYTRQSS